MGDTSQSTGSARLILAFQRRIVAALIVEKEAGPFGGVLVESPGGLSFGEGR
jgi:hypothetical protein